MLISGGCHGLPALYFFIPLLFFTWLLEKTPKPTEDDILLRTERKPMNKKRGLISQKLFPGLFMLLVVHVMLTIIRDYRSNFAANI